MRHASRVPNSLTAEQREGPVCCVLCGLRTLSEDRRSIGHEVGCMDPWCREGSVALGAHNVVYGPKT